MSRILSGLAVLVFAFAPSITARAEVQVGEKPKIEFKAATGGADFGYAQYKGHVVVVEFWASTCGACMAAAPDMVRLNSTYAPRGLQFVGINLDDTAEAMAKAAKEKNFTWPQAFGPEARAIQAQFNVTAIPSLFILGPDGALLWSGRAGALDAAIVDAFKTHPPRIVDPKLLADATAIADQIEASLKEDGGGAAALKLLAKFPAAAKVDVDMAVRAKNLEAQVNEYGTQALADLEPLVTDKKYIEAATKLAELTQALGTLPAGAAAKKRLAELTANPELKAQLTAVQRDKTAADELAVATRLKADKKNEQAYLKFKTIAKAFAGTSAGEEAAAAVAEYEKDPAFVRKATESVTAGKAKGMLGLAAGYVRAGKPELAKKKYEEIIAAYPGTTEAAQAKAGIDEIARNAPR